MTFYEVLSHSVNFLEVPSATVLLKLTGLGRAWMGNCWKFFVRHSELSKNINMSNICWLLMRKEAKGRHRSAPQGTCSVLSLHRMISANKMVTRFWGWVAKWERKSASHIYEAVVNIYLLPCNLFTQNTQEDISFLTKWVFAYPK